MSELLRVESVRIERWGPLLGFERSFPGNDFVLLFGANESGKTSFATALAWLLAGPGERSVLHPFGNAGAELAASMRGRLGTEQLTISASANVPKGATDHLVKEKQFHASLGNDALPRDKLADQLGIGDLDSYRSFYWVESRHVANAPDLTDKLSAQAVFGGIDPYKQSSELRDIAQTALGKKRGHQAKADSARKLCEEVGVLDKQFEKIANARAERDRINGILQNTACVRESIEGQLRSLRLASNAFRDGHVNDVTCWTRQLEQRPPPSPSEQQRYDERERAGEEIGRLERAEEDCRSLSEAAEQPSGTLLSGRWPVLSRISVGSAVVLAAVLASFADSRLSALVVVGACVAAAVLVLRHRNRDRKLKTADEHRQDQLEIVRRRFADTKCIPNSLTDRGDDPAPSGVEAPASTPSADHDVSAPPEIHDANGARAKLQATKSRVEGYDDAVRRQQEACTQLRDAVEHDPAALTLIAKDDPDSLDQQTLDLQAKLEELADGASSVDEKVQELEDDARDFRRLSDEAAGNRLTRAGLVTDARAKIVRGLGHGLAAELLDDTAEEYLKAQQPKLLRQCRRWASNVADWVDIQIVSSSPDDKKQADLEDRLRVVGPRGEHPARRQSFGARSLLYLMLRLATVAEQGEATGVRLPVILDDVLVGLDDVRAERCIGLLRDFSEQHQTILLTCHRDTAERAEAAGAAVLAMP